MDYGISFYRGIHHLDRGETDQAELAFAEDLTRARASGAPSHVEEARHALTRLRLGYRDEAQEAANGLDARTGGESKNLQLAELWAELGDRKRAIEIALRTHDFYVGQGEPYVDRWWLNRTRNLLTSLGEPLPEIRQYNPASDPPEPWEAEVREFFEKVRKERLEREAEEKTQ